MFILTVFETLLFKGRSVLAPTQRITLSERVKYVMYRVLITTQKDRKEYSRMAKISRVQVVLH